MLVPYLERDLACFLIFCYLLALSLAKRIIADLLKVVVAAVRAAAEVVVSHIVLLLHLSHSFSLDSSEPQFLVWSLY